MRTPGKRVRRDQRPAERRGASGNPALVRGAVVAVLALLASLGVGWAADVDDVTLGLIVGVVSAVLALVQAWWTRRAVVPLDASLAYVDEHGVPVAGPAADSPLGEPLTAPDSRGAYLVSRVPRDTP